jgi:hypothetical protein
MPFLFLLGVLVLIGLLIIAGPLLLIWSLNGLFNTGLEFTLMNWLYGFVLMAVLGGSRGSTTVKKT